MVRGSLFELDLGQPLHYPMMGPYLQLSSAWLSNSKGWRCTCGSRLQGLARNRWTWSLLEKFPGPLEEVPTTSLSVTHTFDFWSTMSLPVEKHRALTQAWASWATCQNTRLAGRLTGWILRRKQDTSTQYTYYHGSQWLVEKQNRTTEILSLTMLVQFPLQSPASQNPLYESKVSLQVKAKKVTPCYDSKPQEVKPQIDQNALHFSKYESRPRNGFFPGIKDRWEFLPCHLPLPQSILGRTINLPEALHHKSLVSQKDFDCLGPLKHWETLLLERGLLKDGTYASTGL